MKTVALLTLILALAALKPQQGYTKTEVGWFVHQINGTFKWMSATEWQTLAQKSQQKSKITEELVQFYLYTRGGVGAERLSTNNSVSLQNSNIDSMLPTVILVHGWRNNYTSDFNIHMRDALLAHENYNLISVDWSSTANDIFYYVSRLSVAEIGRRIAKFIDHLQKAGVISFSRLTLIGHSLGAHVTGFAGKNVRNGKVAQIIGLDPAGPLFFYELPEERLSSKDAVYVESIHTCGGRLGFLRPIGVAAFYPNGGLTQPGCYDLFGSCSHRRAYLYYAQAILENNFPSIECDSYTSAITDLCGDQFSTIKMGAPTNFLNATGVFYVPVMWP